MLYIVFWYFYYVFFRVYENICQDQMNYVTMKPQSCC